MIYGQFQNPDLSEKLQHNEAGVHVIEAHHEKLDWDQYDCLLVGANSKNEAKPYCIQKAEESNQIKIMHELWAAQALSDKVIPDMNESKFEIKNSFWKTTFSKQKRGHRRIKIKHVKKRNRSPADSVTDSPPPKKRRIDPQEELKSTDIVEPLKLVLQPPDFQQEIQKAQQLSSAEPTKSTQPLDIGEIEEPQPLEIEQEIQKAQQLPSAEPTESTQSLAIVEPLKLLLQSPEMQHEIQKAQQLPSTEPTKSTQPLDIGEIEKPQPLQPPEIEQEIQKAQQLPSAEPTESTQSLDIGEIEEPQPLQPPEMQQEIQKAQQLPSTEATELLQSLDEPQMEASQQPQQPPSVKATELPPQQAQQNGIFLLFWPVSIFDILGNF